MADSVMPAQAKDKNLYAVILAGGSGSRLWPISRELYPKQLLKLFGRRTLIQQTFDRMKKIVAMENIYVVTSGKFGTDIFLQLRRSGFKKENIIVEPEAKSTAPAIGLAARILYGQSPNSVMLVCPSDHVISADTNFSMAIDRAVVAAKNGFLVTLGIRPDHPSSEYGYIMPCGDVGQETGGQRVKRFVEKPIPTAAEDLIKQGCLWNAGIFAWKTAVILEELEEHLPQLHELLDDYDNGKTPAEFAQHYAVANAVSIDNGVLENCSNVYVVPAEFRWCDIGSWKILYDLLPKGKGKNILNEFALQMDCRDSLLFGTKKRIAVGVGLSGLIVVDTEDAVLVADQGHIHRIKDIFNTLKANGYNQYLEHPTVHRPWGHYTVLEEGPGYKVKIISVKPRETLSLQMHHRRSEQWVVLRGMAKVTLGDKFFYLNAGQSLTIPVETRHRLENPGTKMLEVTEVQFGEYLGEDDIVRFNDKYGRLT